MVAIEESPLIADSLISLEHATVKLDEGLLDDWLVLTSTPLKTHHGGERAASSMPVSGVLVGKILDTRHVAANTFADKDGSIQTERVAVLRVKVAGKSASALVSEEVALRLEATRVFVLGLAKLELFLDEKNKQLFSVDLADLHVAVRISVEKKLLRDARRQEGEKSLRGNSQMASHMLADIALERTRNDLVDLTNEDSDLRDELNEALGYEDDTVIFAKLSTLANDISDLSGNLRQSQSLGLDLLTDQHKVDASAKSTLKSNVRGRATHETDEVIVLL